MGHLIQDVTPANQLPAYLRGYGCGKLLKRARTDMLISELHYRGISIEDIFGQYYAMEAIADARDDEIFGNDEEGQHGDPNRFKPLTVGDAELAGLTVLPAVPTERQPF